MKITFDSKINNKKNSYVVFITQGGGLTASADSLDKETKGLVKKAIKADNFTGKINSFLTITAPQGLSVSYLILVGLGKVADLKSADFEKIGSDFYSNFSKKITSAQFILDKNFKKHFSIEDAANSIARGFLLNSYSFDKYLTKKPKSKNIKIKSLSFVVEDPSKAKKIFSYSSKLVESIFWARDLVTEAPNVLYPESYAKIIKRELSPLGIKVKILGRKELLALGMGAIVSVGKGSVREEKLVVMEYKGGKKTQENIAFVGKGVTFDTGGISLKPGAGMGDMKFDMAGSAAVVGLMKVLAGRKAKANVIGVVALAENMPAGNATRPGDIIKTMSGQTVEILNTDAEGRLVLCDALWYVQEKFKPTQIIDLATLTGAMLVALGHEYAGAFSNNEKMPKRLMEVGADVGEKIWHMPMCDAWDKEMDSPVADIKNIGSGRYAGSSTAAHFLKRFIKKGVAWTHLDIAGTAWITSNKTGTPKGATGFGIRLLDKYVEKYCEK